MTNQGSPNQMADVLQNLATAIAGLNVNKVPPPQPYCGLGSVNDWFTTFERYANALYQNDYPSYLQILPSFLEGEAKNIVMAYGTSGGTDYQTVKDRLVLEMQTRHALGNNAYTDFFSTKRRVGESLVCYSIRLQAMAEKLPNATRETKEVMTKSKFLGGLAPVIAKQVNIHMANKDNVTLDQIVKLATILDSERGCAAVTANQNLDAYVDIVQDPYQGWNDHHIENAHQLMAVAAPAAPNFNRDARQQCYICKAGDHFAKDCPIGRSTRCYHCQNLGHIAKNCPNRNGQPGNQQQQNGNRNFARDVTMENNTGRNATAERGRNSRNEAVGGAGRSSGDQCSYCGKKGHLMKDCFAFEKKLVVCVWCGASHASHTCEHKPSGNGIASGQ